MDNQGKSNNYRKEKHYNLATSFFFALQGIAFAIRWERNLRIHLVAIGYIAFFSIKYYNLPNSHYAILVLIFALVMCCEIINTAIEKTIDLITHEYHPLAKTAKDLAASAVFLSAVASVVIGVLLLWDVEVFARIFSHMIKYFYIWIPIIIATLLAVFLPEYIQKQK